MGRGKHVQVDWTIPFRSVLGHEKIKKEGPESDTEIETSLKNQVGKWSSWSLK